LIWVEFHQFGGRLFSVRVHRVPVRPLILGPACCIQVRKHRCSAAWVSAVPVSRRCPPLLWSSLLFTVLFCWPCGSDVPAARVHSSPSVRSSHSCGSSRGSPGSSGVGIGRSQATQVASPPAAPSAPALSRAQPWPSRHQCCTPLLIASHVVVQCLCSSELLPPLF
jgi:hypothetical protein